MNLDADDFCDADDCTILCNNTCYTVVLRYLQKKATVSIVRRYLLFFSSTLYLHIYNHKDVIKSQ